MSEEAIDALKKATRVLWDLREAMGIPVVRKIVLELLLQRRTLPHAHNSYSTIVESREEEIGGGEAYPYAKASTTSPRPVYAKESRPETPILDEVRKLAKRRAIRSAVAQMLRDQFPASQLDEEKPEKEEKKSGKMVRRHPYGSSDRLSVNEFY